MHLPADKIQRALLTTSSVIKVPLSTTAPSDAIQAPDNYVGFGFETAFINDYANTFTLNLLNSVGKRLGTVPTIRIGGTSGDRVTFDESQEEIKVCIEGDCPIGSAASYILGPSYFDGFKYFEDFGITFQAPLGADLNVSNAEIYVSRAYEQVKDLVAIAIGNEPDLYSTQYGVDYKLGQYVNDSQTIITHVSETLGFDEGDRVFEVLDFASNKPSFDLINVFEDNLYNSTNVKLAAWHWYQLSTDYTTSEELQTYLMNHTAITTHFEPLKSQIAYLKKNDSSISFVLSETGSGTQSSIEIQGGFGAALWCIDFQLYSLSQGVSRVDATHRPAAFHSYWVPDDSAGTINPGPQVRAVWYALPFIADFLGQSPGKVSEIDLQSDTLAAYAIYNSSSNDVSRLAIINLQTWVNGDGSGSSRGSENVSVPVPSGVSSVYVRRLQSAAGAFAMGFDYAGPAENVTWAGEQWSYSIDQGKGHRVEGVSEKETYSVSDGVFEIQIQDSEALSIEF
ncbi:hypothetical protein N7478_012212 [Penicillium angulare]|uniref:uncharacterized protein n=1 Tax=Penicillium angulare TaxID=116970 RepID=UPI002541F727|nr:uncharacterized protein N7478_012212 [Penicillium angulare]KAJ5259231.1 hypothetical protein N7478_012212 [Penicillium angulare]